MIKDIAIQQQKHKQQLFGSPKTHVPHFKLQKYTQERSNFIKKYFFESIPYDKVNPEKIRQNNQRFNNINNIEDKLTHFQIYPETELACIYNKPHYKTQYSEFLVEYEKNKNTGKQIDNPNPTHHYSNSDENSYIPVKFLKNTGRTGGKLRPQDKSSTRLQELSLMNNTYFDAIQRDIHLDMKLDYAISRIIQEMSLSELETLHHLCELIRTQILQPLALALLNIPYAGYLLSRNRSRNRTKTTQSKMYRTDFFPLIEKENLTDKIKLSGPPDTDSKNTINQNFNLHDSLDNIPLSKLEIENIFLPNTEKLTLELLQKDQNLDPVIRQLKSWYTYKTKPMKADITILGNKTLLRYF